MSGFLTKQIEPQVLLDARRGKPAAQETLYLTFSTPVYTLAIRILRKPELAEEILQDTFMEVLQKLDSYRGDAPLGAWIRTIAMNKCLMHLRSAWNRYATPLEGRVQEALVYGHAGVTQAEAGAAMDLDQALGYLSARSRAVVWMHDVEGYTHAEIGKMMNRSTSFSKSQLSRAHSRLRDLLREPDEAQACMQVLNNY